MPRMRRRKAASLLIMLSMLLASKASPAQATTFDSAHEPPKITSPGVDLGESYAASVLELPGYHVEIDFSLSCLPAPGEPFGGQPEVYTATLEDPTGSVTLALQNGCNDSWQTPPPRPAGQDFTVATEG